MAGELSRLVLRTWSNQHEVWITKWALLDSPPNAMEWVEGDDPVVRWRDIPTYFRQFDFDRSTARPDGFLRLAGSAKNRTLLEGAAAHK